MLPSISIVTPSYQQAPYLEECIRSVLDQDYPRLEYLVLDGGSTDGSREIIERYADRLTFWRSAPDEGQAAALRDGFDRASGDILAWVNSDDVLAEGSLRTVAETWDRHGGGVMVVGACQLFGDDGPHDRHLASFTTSRDEPVEMPHDRVFDLARHWFPGEFFYQPEVFFPRSDYEAVGGIDPGFYYTMDYDLWARFALHGTRVVVIDETLAWYREHDAQKTADQQALFREMIATAEGYLDRSALPPDERRRIATWNRRAEHPVVRELFKLRHRLARTA